MKCVQCDVDLAGDARFCTGCGAKQALACGSCAAELPITAKFCGLCGVATGGPAAVAPLPPLPEAREKIEELNRMVRELTVSFEAIQQEREKASRVKVSFWSSFTGSAFRTFDGVNEKLVAMAPTFDKVINFDVSSLHPSAQPTCRAALEEMKARPGVQMIQQEIERALKWKSMKGKAKGEKIQSAAWGLGALGCVGLFFLFVKLEFGPGLIACVIGGVVCGYMQKKKISDAEDNEWRARGASEEEVALRREEREIEEEISSAESAARNSSKSVVDRLNAQSRAEGAKQRLLAVQRDIERVRYLERTR